MMDGDATVVIGIDGMSCQHCVAAIEKGLKSMPGVAEVRVSLTPGQAAVSGRSLDVDAMKETIRDLGYTPA